MRAPLPYLYFALSALVLGVYAARSYPLLATLPAYHIVLGFGLPFVVASLFKAALEPALVERAHALDQPARQFMLDLGLFALAGLVALLLLSGVLGLPVALGAQVFLGALIIGYFASLDHALWREREGFRRREPAPDGHFEPVSFPARLSLFLTITVLVVMTVMGTAAYRHLQAVAAQPGLATGEIWEVFVVDALFIFGVMMSLALRLIYSYSLNLRLVFTAQTDILRKVQSGVLDEYVPIMGRDEFGVIARQINRMIDGLREKDRIRRTLEQIVSPNITERLLNGDVKALKAGQECEVAVLFCDLRNFTSFAESSAAEEVIFFLNSLFSQMVETVSAHRGIVNKFMGDAILAIYGLESRTSPVDDAVSSAWEILERVQATRLPGGERLDIGIGIHAGRAVAGTIGSEERYEYTFIGDTVNTASRLEGLTKRLGYRLIVSADAYEELGAVNRQLFVDLRKHMLRGKSEPVHVYGAAYAKAFNHTPARPTVQLGSSRSK